MPHIDDTRPFYRMAKGLAEKVEEKRQQFNEYRRKNQIGTFAGLEETIKRRQEEARNAKRNSH
jgi:hypothetical protein